MAARLMTPDEAAALLNMEARTLVKWARKGYVPAHPLGEGRRRLWRFFEDELVKWIAGQQGNGGRSDGQVR